MLYSGHSLEAKQGGGAYPFAEMGSAYFIAPADWFFRGSDLFQNERFIAAMLLVNNENVISFQWIKDVFAFLN